jgi:hypothetical protein
LPLGLADIRDVFAERRRQIDLVVLLVDQDLPNLFGERKFSQII